LSAVDTVETTALDPRDLRIRELEEELQSVRKKLPLDVDPIAKEVKKRFLRFILDQVNPGYQERQKGDLRSWSRDLWKEASRLGLLGFNAPKELGGEGRDTVSWNLVLEELGKLIEDPGFLIIIMINKIWAGLILHQGKPHLVERYAKPMIKGEISLSWAVWEPADLTFMQSVAKKVDGGYVLNADKPMLTGGLYAGVYAVAVRDEASSEPILFLVDRDTKGVEVKPQTTVGGQHIGYASLKIKDAFVPQEQLLLEYDALSAVAPRFDFGALDAVAVHLGWMQRMIDLCADTLRPKVRMGMPVLNIPHVQAEMGRLFMGTEVARAMFLRTLEKARAGDPSAEGMVVIFKHFLTDRVLDTAKTVMALQGASGYMDDNPWGRYFTLTICLLHAAGAQDLLSQQVGERMLMQLEMKRLRKVGF